MMHFNRFEIAAYLFYFLLSIFISFLINWLFLKFTRNLRAKNNDDLNQERWKTDTKPAVGGFSFYIVFLISISLVSLFTDTNLAEINKKIVGVLAASTLGFIIGLADDTYNTNPLIKFMGQLTCSFILILMGVYIPATGNIAIDFGLTTIWVIGLMNSINMLDNMDGITTSISMTILLSAIIFVLLGNNATNLPFLVLLLGVFGALIGFLYYNWSPAKIYMGDTGSQFLGVFLAAISIIFFWNENEQYAGALQIKQFVMPMLVFIVPLIDTTTVFIRRIMRKQSPFVGGRDHTTHLLVFYGFTEKQVAYILIAISLLSIPLVTVLNLHLIHWNWIISSLAFIYFAAWFAIMQVIYNRGLDKKR